MKRLLCDTCVFGFLAIDPEIEDITSILKQSTSAYLCRFSIIRNELRGQKHGKKAQVALPALYDRLTKGQEYAETSKIEALASLYYQHYRTHGGKVGRKKMMKDFKIVACASINGMTVVVSGDSKTMFGTAAMKAYKTANVVYGSSIIVNLLNNGTFSALLGGCRNSFVDGIAQLAACGALGSLVLCVLVSSIVR